ncbi:helix-turn-helix domain-containing protein [Candidatus Dependentiae bacterium]|nr:helix-turn-helix domain-containing protein [Candidatus Dependentiae bacterium]
MKITVKLDEVMVKNKIRLNELSKKVGITEANLSILKNGKAKAIRFSTLESLCQVLNCQPGDILEFENDN